MSLDAIGIIAVDLELTKKFYQILDLEFTAFGDDDHWEATMKSGLRVMLDSEELMMKINPDYKRRTGGSDSSVF